MTPPREASETAALAADVAATLKPGSYEAVQALSLLSIAQSLAHIAEALDRGDARIE